MRKYLVIFSLLLFASCSKKQDVATPKSSAKLISSFSLNAFNPVIAGTINQTALTISLSVPFGTDVTALVPAITVSAGASVSPISGKATNFTNPMQYTVTAADGSTQVYTVTVLTGKSSLKAITGFSFSGLNPVVNCTVNETSYTITGTVPYGTAITALVPTITVSAQATVSPASGVAGNFTNAVNYTVTAEDGSTQVYKVTISVLPLTGEPLAAQLIANATYPSTYGVIAQINSAEYTFWNAITYPKDTTVTAASASGVVPSFNYTSTWLDTQKVVNEGGPNDLIGFDNSFKFNGTGSYNDGSFYSSNYTDAGNFALTYLYTNIPYTTSYSRSETVVSLTGSKNTFTDKFTWTSTNILVNKSTGVIMSGTATVSIQITVSGQVSSYTGTITFSGNNQASLVLNSGTSYPLKWQ